MGDSLNKRENWNGLIGFILAGAGSAVGLGNVWKFPYITGMNGGGAFVMIYLCCIVLIGLPLMLCEIAIGRKTQKNPFGAFRALHPEKTKVAVFFGVAMLLCGVSLLILGSYGMGIMLVLGGAAVITWGWAAVGALGVLIPVLIISYYNVVGGWTLIYAVESLVRGGALADAQFTDAHFGVVASSWKYSLAGTGIFSIFVLLTVWFGVSKGIERVSKVLMPLLVLMLIALIIRSVTLPGSTEGISFLLTPHFGKLTAAGVLEALGHAFYTLSLGMGIVITYGSYLPKERNILGASIWIIILDTTIALMAGLAIFPALFAVGMAPEAGPGLVFKIMPVTLHSFGDGLGALWCFLFFGLLFIAALTSSISLLEVPVAFCMDQLKWRRRTAAGVSFIVISVLSLLSVFGAANWENILWAKDAIIKLMGESHLCGSFFDQMDIFCSNYLLPLSGLLTSLFAAYVWKSRNCLAELRQGAGNIWDTSIWLAIAGLRGDEHVPGRNQVIFTPTLLFGIFIRIFAPIAIIICFMNVIGWINLT